MSFWVKKGMELLKREASQKISGAPLPEGRRMPCKVLGRRLKSEGVVEALGASCKTEATVGGGYPHFPVTSPTI